MQNGKTTLRLMHVLLSILAVLKLLFFSLRTRIQSACLRVIKYSICVCISIFRVFGWVPRVFKQRLIICCCAPLFRIKHTGKVTSERCHTNTSIASCGQSIPTNVMLPFAKFFVWGRKEDITQCSEANRKLRLCILCPRLRLLILLRHCTVIAALKILGANNDCTAC